GADERLDARLAGGNPRPPVAPHAPAVHADLTGIQLQDCFDKVDRGLSGALEIVQRDPGLAGVAFALTRAVNCKRRHAATPEMIVVGARHVLLDGIHAWNDQHARRLHGAWHGLQNAGYGPAVLERNSPPPNGGFVEQLRKPRVAMDQPLIELELARRVGMNDPARRAVIQRRTVIEFGSALAVTVSLRLFRELLLLLGGAHPLL